MMENLLGGLDQSIEEMDSSYASELEYLSNENPPEEDNNIAVVSKSDKESLKPFIAPTSVRKDGIKIDLLREHLDQKDYKKGEVFLQYKYDGYNCNIFLEKTKEGRIIFKTYSKNGKSLNFIVNRDDDLCDELESMQNVSHLHPTRLHGELVAIRNPGPNYTVGTYECLHQFSRDHSKCDYTIGIILWDISLYWGVDLRKMTYSQRFRVLTNNFRSSPRIHVARTHALDFRAGNDPVYQLENIIVNAKLFITESREDYQEGVIFKKGNLEFDNRVPIHFKYKPKIFEFKFALVGVELMKKRGICFKKNFRMKKGILASMNDEWRVHTLIFGCYDHTEKIWKTTARITSSRIKRCYCVELFEYINENMEPLNKTYFSWISNKLFFKGSKRLVLKHDPSKMRDLKIVEVCCERMTLSKRFGMVVIIGFDYNLNTEMGKAKDDYYESEIDYKVEIGCDINSLTTFGHYISSYNEQGCKVEM